MEASIHSLSLQGGPMSPDEILKFEENPNLEKIITVRHLDDAGKDPNLETSDFWYFAPLVQRMVEEKNATVE